MTSSERFQPDVRQVDVLLPAGGQVVGTLGLVEVLDTANRVRVHAGRAPLYDVRVVGIDPETPTSIGPIVRTAPAEPREPHTFVVGGALALIDGPPEPRLLEVADAMASTAERVVSVCTGAFVLGALGWLDGRSCTTHWLGVEALKARFPAARVEPDALYTEDGRVLTSAGASAGIDLGLHLVSRDGGPRLAVTVARLLVVFAHRPGGQSQFGSAVRVRHDLDGRLRDLVDHVLERPGDDHRVDVLAARVGMSPRNFARVFRAELGETPAAFVARVRVEAAQRSLQLGDEPVERIAEGLGFGTATTFRRTFARVVGVSPAAWRARFSA